MTSNTAMADNTTDGKPPFSEHRVPRGQGSIYARDYKGAGPAFVLMHGFPDNLHIYDDLVPYLVAGRRRVVAFDFLGFGASEKPLRGDLQLQAATRRPRSNRRDTGPR
jgi:pimeloyl-ACP methyl ester carboxylesterase